MRQPLILFLIFFSSITLFGNILWVDAQVLESENEFVYHWEQGAHISGSEYSSYINKPLQITFIDEELSIPNNSASQQLQDVYKIFLSNQEINWGPEHSYAILKMLDTIPHTLNNNSDNFPSKWVLSERHIENDIKINKTNSHKIITISMDAFENANPKLAIIDEKQGKFFSKRLHHALVWYVTDEGKDMDAIEKILNERFGTTTKVSDFKKLTKYTTSESEQSFQEFHPWELIEIINTWEELPEEFQLSDGLNYLVRRADGTPHPFHPMAPAVSWPSEGYLEFMESAFIVDDNYLHKLIIHEKTHFLWSNVFSNQIKSDWISIGGWYQDKSKSGWLTSKTTEFVTGYAHANNPDEDMAESLAYYLTNPDKLKSRSLPKYEFIRDNIMQEAIYLSVIREDLTFNVQNLNPDYVYPGKIIRVDISVLGKKDQDKNALIEIELDSQHSFQSAKHAFLRLTSEIGTFKDVYLYPVENSLGSILRGELSINKNSKNGFWTVDQITITDNNGNQRFEGSNDFGWQFFVNNYDEDLTPPEYVKNTLKLSKRLDTDSYSRPVQILQVIWKVNENNEMKNCFVRIDNEDPASYSMDSWGRYDSTNKTCIVEFQLTEYNRSGNYSIRYFKMVDMAGNQGDVSFSDLTENYSIFIETENQDIIKPFLDVNDISISAVPTNLKNPTGETKISLMYHAKDDKSGLGLVYFSIRDPQGITHSDYHYHENFYTLFFKGKSDELKQYEINFLLPEGSPPGKYGLTHMLLVDKANNKITYEFTEIIHFTVN